MINSEDKKIIIKRVIVELIIFVLLLTSDLLSKDLVMNRLGLAMNRQYTLIDGVFAIYPCLNDGASFSAFSGMTGFLIALTSIMSVAMVALAIFNLIKKPKTSMLFRWALILIIAGALGNLYDRIFCDGKVRDFIQYLFLDGMFEKLFNTSFGIGNIADIYLVLGVFLMCGYIIFDYKEGDLGILKPKKVKDEIQQNDEIKPEDKIDDTIHENGVKSTDTSENIADSEVKEEL